MTTPPYALVADVHCHSWSQFAKINSDGINTRLQAILDELTRAATELKAAGGTTLRVAGDLFHVRGKIEPSVFNPTFETFKRICGELGIDVEIIPGNHDLEGTRADQLGNAMQQLDLIDGCDVIIEPRVEADAVLLPWIEDLDELRATAKKLAEATKDLIIHAPLNGVIKGLPDHGLDPAEVAAWGYRRVFIGHYHHHVEQVPGVFSIGATTHQTWSDPNTIAGFCLVYPDRVEHRPTQAPLFINIDDSSQIGPHVKGNYVRIRYKDATEEELKKLKAVLDANRCAGYVDHSSRKREVTRTNAVGPTNLTLEASVNSYVQNHLDAGGLDRDRIAKDALDILTEARTVGVDE